MDASHVLGISTSSGIAKLALVRQALDAMGQVLSFLDQRLESVFECEIQDYKSQSAELLPRLHAAMQALGLKREDIAAIGVDVGPGGFTSLRTSCGLAQGLCTAWNVPAVPVTSFEAMFAQWVLLGGDARQTVTCVIDARLNELYCAQLKPHASEGIEFSVKPHLRAASDFPPMESGPLLGDAGAQALAIQAGLTRLEVCPASALGVSALAWQALQQGRLHSAFDCQPLYVREKVAQTTSERLALKHGLV